MPAKKVAAKSARSNHWFLRITGPVEYLRTKCSEMLGWIDLSSCLAVHHSGRNHTDKKERNSHMHMVMTLTSHLQKQSIDDRLKKLWNVEKGLYSSKVWDGIRDAGASSYLFHEEEDCEILARKHWSDEELDTAKAANKAVQKVVAINKERASTKLVDKALEHFSGKDPSRTEILFYMVAECRDGNNYYPGSFLLKRYVEEVQLKLCDDKRSLETFVFSLEAQLWR